MFIAWPFNHRMVIQPSHGHSMATNDHEYCQYGDTTSSSLVDTRAPTRLKYGQKDDLNCLLFIKARDHVPLHRGAYLRYLYQNNNSPN